MSITDAVHYTRTMHSEISLAFKAGDFQYFLKEVMNLPSMSTELLLSVLIPLGLYIIVKRLRYLSKLRSEHNNIFEAALGRNPLAMDELKPETKSEKESSPTYDKKGLFQTGLTPPFGKGLKPL
ncbi:MAG: hypothetical protein Roseis2KO_09370 [Roseivirga sp.]